jgi:hypothetical protein
MTMVKTVPFQSAEGLPGVVVRGLQAAEVLPDVLAHAAKHVTEASATRVE